MPSQENSFSTTRRFAWPIVALAILIVALVVASFYIDPLIRSRVENTMNQRLVGYHTRLQRAHLRLFDGALTLSGLKVVQNAHPEPPVADLPLIRTQVQWRELFSGRVVAECLLQHPAIHVNLIQLRHERADPVPIGKKGWQDALQAIYPFKINKFRIRDGDITYTDTDPNRPLHLQNLNLTADNIRNIHSPDYAYPSSFSATAVVFQKGHAQIKGHANFLAKPYPAFNARYWIKDIPLGNFAPEVKRVNFKLEGGVLQINGMAEYSPKIKNVEIYKAHLSDVKVHYFHTAATAPAEARHTDQAKQEARKVANQPGVLMKVDELDVANSYAGFDNDAKSPGYKLFISDLNFRVTNLSNHFSEGPSNFDLRGLFMGSGNTRFTGAFRPEKQGPDFDLNAVIENTNLPAMNDLLRTYGRFDVSTGNLSVYSQMTVQQGQIKGYVKPLFTNLKVYSLAKDKNKPILTQAYELAVGGAAKLLKNRSTDKVATEVNISGKISNPKVSTWEALVEFAENAFVNAILPGFDRQSIQRAASNN